MRNPPLERIAAQRRTGTKRNPAYEAENLAHSQTIRLLEEARRRIEQLETLKAHHLEVLAERGKRIAELEAINRQQAESLALDRAVRDLL